MRLLLVEDDYRRAGTAASGSGIGLSIVKAIADAYGATVTLTDGPEGRGLKVIVALLREWAPQSDERSGLE